MLNIKIIKSIIKISKKVKKSIKNVKKVLTFGKNCSNIIYVMRGTYVRTSLKEEKNMKEIKLEMKGKYEDVVEYINKNIEIEEPTTFLFTKIVETNAKMRRRKEYKNIYSYEVEGKITLNDNNHKNNLYRKVCLPTPKYSYTAEDFAMYGID